MRILELLESYVPSGVDIHNTPGWKLKNVKQKLSNALSLHFRFLKIICFLHPRCHWQIIGDVKYTKCKMYVSSYHVTYPFRSESTPYSCLNVKELLARRRREIWSLSDCNWTQNHNHLVHKQTLNHLAKLTNWLSCVVSTYLYGAYDYMFLSCHIRVSEWIHTL